MKIFKWIPLLAITLLFAACKKDDDSNSENITPNDFLSANRYNKLVVEIQSMEGYAPEQATLNNLQSFLEALLNKPEGISITSNTISAQGKGSYSLDDIQSIESTNRTQNASGNTIAAYILFLDGDYAGNDGSGKVLGIQYKSTSMVMFEKTIQDLTGGFGEPSEEVVETSVIEHEFGHTLGLVNNGTVMAANHQDTEHGAHCNVESCLMYYATETSNFIGNLTGGSVPTLDAQCRADLRANGGK